mgnify:CR=1 FL=1
MRKYTRYSILYYLVLKFIIPMVNLDFNLSKKFQSKVIEALLNTR